MIAIVNKILPEEQYLPWKGVCGSDLTPTTLLKDLHGAPPGSFVVELSVIIGGFKSLQKMASFWCSVIAEVSNWICFLLRKGFCFYFEHYLTIAKLIA